MSAGDEGVGAVEDVADKIVEVLEQVDEYLEEIDVGTILETFQEDADGTE